MDFEAEARAFLHNVYASIALAGAQVPRVVFWMTHNPMHNAEQVHVDYDVQYIPVWLL